jgi:geranylgeranyl diphosphate synthase, type I
VIRYHLGFLNARFEPDSGDAGKRIRPRLCVLACEAAGGDPATAIHTAAAIELIHNFTLIHDDIQDRSPLRRHRDTIWHIWGTEQAINAGDATFALAHLALNRSRHSRVAADIILRLSSELHLTTLRIVEGQVLDLGFESRDDVSASDYLSMIGGKTAAICRCATWAGGLIAGVDDEQLASLAEFGFALGIGFQLRDDLLGIWGSREETGKAEADDIRRRKKSLPILLLMERASALDAQRLHTLYREPELGPAAVAEVLQMLSHYEVRDDVQSEVRAWHDRAQTHLRATLRSSPSRDALEEMVRSLESRMG